MGSKQNPRKIIHMWAEKELHNLVKMAKGGVRVPEPVVLKKHVLVMSFIGAEGRPAPKLKEAAERMSEKQMEDAYNQVVEMMVQLYHVCHLVHADLSEHGILWWEKECWFIDVSQAVEPIHPSGLDFLFRDCTNVSTFFSKHGVDTLSPGDLFSHVSGLETSPGTEAEILSQIRRYQKNAAVKITAGSEQGDGDDFEVCWQQSKEEVPEGKPIPGHPRSIPAHKSPRPKSPRSPGAECSKSPRSPVSDIVGLPDEDLRKLKISLLSSSPGKEVNVVHSRKTQI